MKCERVVFLKKVELDLGANKICNNGVAVTHWQEMCHFINQILRVDRFEYAKGRAFPLDVVRELLLAIDLLSTRGPLASPESTNLQIADEIDSSGPSCGVKELDSAVQSFSCGPPKTRQATNPPA